MTKSIDTLDLYEQLVSEFGESKAKILSKVLGKITIASKEEQESRHKHAF